MHRYPFASLDSNFSNNRTTDDVYTSKNLSASFRFLSLSIHVLL